MCLHGHAVPGGPSPTNWTAYSDAAYREARLMASAH